MSDIFDSPRRRPVASGSDTLLYTPEKREQHFATIKEPPDAAQDNQFPKAAGMVLGYGSVWGFELMSHPFLVLRRSCQTGMGSSHHLLPFSLMPVVYNLSSNKPPAWVYKGFVSTLLARGFNMVTENFINEISSWPLQVSAYSSVKKQCQHLLLKWCGFLICTPLHVSSFVETVQSYGANEPPALFEFITEGFNRLIGLGYRAAWIVPMWKLLVPTATFRLCHYFIQQIMTHLITRIFTEERNNKQMSGETSGGDGSRAVDTTSTQYEQIYPGLVSTFGGMLLADTILYPVETVLHRLYIQGTRVLLENMDHGREVLGVQFQYSGILDCAWHMLVDEGITAFYRGFGALLLQYFCHFVGLKMLEYGLRQLESYEREQSKQKRVLKPRHLQSNFSVL